MKIMGFDTETTGLKANDGDRIIEVALLTYDFATRELVDEYVQRIDPDRSIAAAAQAVHGIRYEDLVGMPRFKEVASEIHKRFTEADCVVAHNLNFDAMFLMAEFGRVGIVMPQAESVDTMTDSRWACPDGKFPRLGELAFALQVPFDPAKAHGAAYDVTVMMACFFAGLDRGFYALPAMSPAQVW